jgi:hypothetical protein
MMALKICCWWKRGPYILHNAPMALTKWDSVCIHYNNDCSENQNSPRLNHSSENQNSPRLNHSSENQNSPRLNHSSENQIHLD